MKSLMLLFKIVLLECGTRCCTSTLRDLKTVHARVEHEGLSFLTITLPTFCRDFETCLDKGKVEPTDFFGFKKTGAIPSLFSGMLSLVFDRETGALVDEPDTVAIQSIRQISLLFGKIELPCSEARERSAFAGFIDCEQEVTANTWDLFLNRPQDLRRFQNMSRKLFSRVFSQADHDVYYGKLIPKHGPGSTADGLSGNLKFVQSEWTSRLEPYFPASEYILGSIRQWEDLEAINFLEPGSERPVKVISVPKTLKTPRIIAVEPTCMQYTQQALQLCLRSHIAGDARLLRMLNFQSQVPNQVLAKEGSAQGHLATLDLSEASDRVSNLLVQYLFADHPYLDGAVQACRSTRADVPGFGIVSLSKFASMGSALTFPIEAFVFLTIIFLGIEESLGHTLTSKEIDNLSDVVRVYGDDIIVPVDYVHSVISSLESYGMKVNESKSFWNGKFRESCGSEYYDGVDVTVTRLRREISGLTERDAETIVSLTSFRNQMYFRGYWDVARALDGMVGAVLPHFPTVLPTSAAIGRHSYLGYVQDRIGGRYQAPQVRAFIVSSVNPSSYIDDDAALLKCFLLQHRGLQATEDEKHLLRAGRPRSVTLKTSWVSPF